MKRVYFTVRWCAMYVHARIKGRAKLTGVRWLPSIRRAWIHAGQLAALKKWAS